MIISHKYKFIFIKTQKTAGTSVEIALSKFLGPDDVITTITAKDEKVRNSLGFRGPQNYLMTTRDILGFRLLEYLFRVYRYGGWKKQYPRKFFTHMPARNTKEIVPRQVWDNYYKFSIERNPWDRAVSMYHWRKYNNQNNFPEFPDFIKLGRAARSNFDLYTINGLIALDKIVLYEDLYAGLDEVSARIGLPEPITAAMQSIKAKGDVRPKKLSYRSYYDEETRKILAIQAAREIAQFGYEF